MARDAGVWTGEGLPAASSRAGRELEAADSLVPLGGLLGLVGIRNPGRVVLCEDCAGGQLAGQPLDAALHQAPGPLAQRDTPVTSQA